MMTKTDYNKKLHNAEIRNYLLISRISHHK